MLITKNFSTIETIKELGFELYQGYDNEEIIYKAIDKGCKGYFVILVANHKTVNSVIQRFITRYKSKVTIYTEENKKCPNFMHIKNVTIAFAFLNFFKSMAKNFIGCDLVIDFRKPWF
jgi:hypothetical protein